MSNCKYQEKISLALKAALHIFMYEKTDVSAAITADIEFSQQLLTTNPNWTHTYLCILWDFLLFFFILL